VLGMD